MVGVRALSGSSCETASTATPKSWSQRWADVTASDDDDDDVEFGLLPALPIIDDSYRDPPLAVLEDSCDGLNRRLRGAAGPEAGPKDFSFLLQGAVKAPQGAEVHERSGRACATTSLGEAEAGAEASEPGRSDEKEASVSRPAWQPNLHATEFIPTLSMACPLVAICGMLPEAEPLKELQGSPALQCSATSWACHQLDSPEKGSKPSFRLPAESRRRASASRKRRPPVLQVPAMKRTKSEERQPPALHGQMPDASEEEWQHRIEMRRKAVAVGKKTREYHWYCESKARREHEEGEPRTPDPTDRTISKRRWKYDVQQWRTALKQRYVEEGQGSVISTEEWQSSITMTTEEADCCTAVDVDEDSSV